MNSSGCVCGQEKRTEAALGWDTSNIVPRGPGISRCKAVNSQLPELMSRTTADSLGVRHPLLPTGFSTLLETELAEMLRLSFRYYCFRFKWGESHAETISNKVGTKQQTH